jgi:hypothetical protein
MACVTFDGHPLTFFALWNAYRPTVEQLAADDVTVDLQVRLGQMPPARAHHQRRKSEVGALLAQCVLLCPGRVRDRAVNDVAQIHLTAEEVRERRRRGPPKDGRRQGQRRHVAEYEVVR